MTIGEQSSTLPVPLPQLVGPAHVVSPRAATAHAPDWPGKRALDVAMAMVLLVAGLPLFALIAALVKLSSKGPVLFRQTRVGRGGHDFPLLKFRTMHVDSEARLRSDAALYELFLNGAHKIASDLDPRVTRIGRILRRLSLDEFPQLLNVVAGHMSMVGPRPVERSQLVRDYDGYEWAYTGLRPGLTGLWQVSGRSTWMDARIILRTPIVVVTGLGAD